MSFSVPHTLNSSTLSYSCKLELSKVTRFSSGIPEKWKAKTSFEILLFNTYILKNWSSLCLGIHAKVWGHSVCSTQKHRDSTLRRQAYYITLSLNAPLCMCVCTRMCVCMCQRARVLCLCNCISVMSWLFVRWAKALCRQQMINTRVKRKKERPIWIRDSSFFTALLWSSGEAWWSDQGCCKQWDKEWDGRGEWWDFPLWEYMDVLRFLHLYTLTLSFSSWYYCMCTAMYACVCVCVCVLTHTHISNGKSCLSPHPPYQILDWIRSACFGLKRISPHAFCMRL